MSRIGRQTCAGFLGWALLAGNAAAAPSVWMNFDDLPATRSNDPPAGSATWLYTTKEINSNAAYGMTQYDTCGWRNTNAYPAPFTNNHNYLQLYFNTYNSDHMGFETYGYLEVDGGNAVTGHSLKYVVTGGKNSYTTNSTEYLLTNGLKATSKAHFTNWLGMGVDPVAWGATVGHPYVYFLNLSTNPIPEAQGANRLSFYYFVPSSLSNGPGGWGQRPEPTVNIGPFNGVGGHWYHEICTQGGGWTRALCDGHPQHNNAWSGAAQYPYPSSSLRSYGSDYFTNLYRWYISFKPHDGIGRAPYAVWFDEIEFQFDPEPQNDETICSPSVVYFPSNKTFEIGFMDKYKNFAYSYSTYELRYSFDPIDNANWASAAPAHILADSRYSISNRWDGKFQKFWPYYQSVWAPFELATPQDSARLIPGTNVYFAVKDISQQNGDGMLPITNCTIGRWTIGGRNYFAYSNSFDYAGDQPALPLLKRISFRIPDGSPDADGDGVEDWWEQLNFGDPANGQPGADPDGDQLANLAEAAEKTNPHIADMDADGFNDRQELIAGTGFRDASSFPRIESVHLASGGPALSWHGVTQRLYSICETTNLFVSATTTNVYRRPGQNATMTCTNLPSANEGFSHLLIELPGFPW
ncbi:MAG TPA: hypothetical protein DCZ95_11605 [Verrucomicrobia bacterium]|nr:MAG: hypothetical protein A2X46_01820 [Lentisphaerae bacterium GWF2_57_35]HBA84730.1 hypothetical protein [Verrucomicrobiota bacterium]